MVAVNLHPISITRLNVLGLDRIYHDKLFSLVDLINQYWVESAERAKLEQFPSIAGFSRISKSTLRQLACRQFRSCLKLTPLPSLMSASSQSAMRSWGLSLAAFIRHEAGEPKVTSSCANCGSLLSNDQRL